MSTIYDIGSAPATGAFVITPSDSVNLTARARSLWVGGAGNLSLVFNDGSSATITGVPVGTHLPFRVRRVNLTGTTATAIVGLI